MPVTPALIVTLMVSLFALAREYPEALYALGKGYLLFLCFRLFLR
jgi:hypothetical protein